MFNFLQRQPEIGIEFEIQQKVKAIQSKLTKNNKNSLISDPCKTLNINSVNYTILLNTSKHICAHVHFSKAVETAIHKHANLNETVWLTEGNVSIEIYDSNDQLKYSRTLAVGESFSIPFGTKHRIVPLVRSMCILRFDKAF